MVLELTKLFRFTPRHESRTRQPSSNCGAKRRRCHQGVAHALCRHEGDLRHLSQGIRTPVAVVDHRTAQTALLAHARRPAHLSAVSGEPAAGAALGDDRPQSGPRGPVLAAVRWTALTRQRTAGVCDSEYAVFAWLVDAGYLAGNPLSLSRQRARKAKPRVTRFLEDDLWQAVKTSIDAMPRDTAREQEHYARVRWLLSLLYLMGLRISEVVSNPMGGFFRRRDREGQDRWWLAITGKGDKERLLPATTELMAELTRYRRHYGLAALPYSGEATPLLLPIGGTHRPLTRGGVHLIIKQVFDNAVGHLQSTGEAHERATERLRQASAHWLRHTTGSRMMDGQVDLRYVRDNLGHESISTTSQYLHADDDDRHRATEAGLRLNW